jgi:hypothetical protein
VSPNVEPTITLSGNDTLCDGQTVVIKSSFAQSYQWYPNNFGNISFTTDTSGFYAIKTVDVFGCATYSDTIQIVVLPNPPAAVISISNDTLFANTLGNLQWYYNGAAILGATNSFYLANQTGAYSVAVIGSNGCSALSNSIATGIEAANAETNDWNIYPNPNTGKFTLEIGDVNSGIITISITTIEGSIVYEKLFSAKDQVNGLLSINCDYLSAGNYIISLKGQKHVQYKKITIAKN